MTATTIVAALVILTAVGLVVWAWSTMARLEEELRLLGGFERMHFEIGPHAREGTEGSR